MFKERRTRNMVSEKNNHTPFEIVSCPTGPFTILSPQNQEIAEFYQVQERRAADIEAPKVWKGRDKPWL